jgi:carotenoid phi-ring synthase / carotenoid chi-ring synthase
VPSVNNSALSRFVVTMHDNHFPVIIIGGGLAGLTAAAYLTDSDHAPLILETNTTWAGGRLCGGEPDVIHYQGQSWSFDSDHGMHALWGGYHNMRATIERFTDITLVNSEGELWINRWGRHVRAIEAGNNVRNTLIPAPFHYMGLLFRPAFWRTIIPLDFLSLPGYLFSMGFATSFDPIRESSRLDGLMMNEFFRGWTPNLRATFTGLAVNLLAAPKENITLTGFIAAMRFYTILRRDHWQMQFFPDPPAYSYLQDLIQHVEAGGGAMRQGARALQIQRQDDGWRVVYEDSRLGGLRSAYARQIVLATDALAAQRLLAASPDLQPESARLRFPPAIRNAVIRIWFDAVPTQTTTSGMFTGDFVIDNFFWLHHRYERFQQWHQATGGGVIEVHLYGSESLLDQDDRYLLILAVNDVQMAFPALRGHFVHGVVRRNSRTQTDFRVPDETTLNVETPWPGITACGDWIAHDTPTFWMERATTTGIAAANATLGRTVYPIHAPRPPEFSARVYGGIGRGLRALLAPIINPLRRKRR